MNSPIDMSLKPQVTGFFSQETNTISYVVKDPTSSTCAAIDSVMDLDYAAGRISSRSADRLIDYMRGNGLRLEWLCGATTVRRRSSSANLRRQAHPKREG
jgi:hypothetical protein